MSDGMKFGDVTVHHGIEDGKLKVHIDGGTNDNEHGQPSGCGNVLMDVMTLIVALMLVLL